MLAELAVIAPVPEPGAIRDRAGEILGRSEFHRHKSLVQRILDWIGDQLSRFRFGAGHGPGWFGDLIGVLLVAGAIVLVIVLVRSLRPTRSIDALDEVTVEETASWGAERWRREAERLEAAGRWRDALRARYAELVRTLVDERVLDDVPGRTTGEYRTELAEARPDAADAFALVTDLFEAAWYGGAATGPDELARARQAAVVVIERARARDLQPVAAP